MLIVASLVAALFPMTLYMIIIWRMDKFEPEPFWAVFKHFLWGAFGAIILAIFGSHLISLIFDANLSPVNSALAMTWITAPIVEELTKASYLRKIYYNENFDNLTDGLVYGGAIGLGFGMTENFFYFITYSENFNDWLFLVIIRSGFSALMHCITTGLFGAFLGYIKFSSSGNKFKLTILALIIAMAIHSCWNLSVSFSTTYPLGFLFMFMLILLFISLFIYSLKIEKSILKTELEAEIPGNMIPIICSEKRFSKGWIDEKIRLNLLSTVTKLAFRKRQMRNLKNDEVLEREIELLRSKVSKLIYPDVGEVINE